LPLGWSENFSLDDSAGTIRGQAAQHQHNTGNLFLKVVEKFPAVAVGDVCQKKRPLM
jgi:hypothetical protein